MDDMNQYLQQMNAAAASQSLSDASVAAQSAKEQAKTEYERFKQGVVEGVTGPLVVDLFEKAVEKGGLKVAEKVGLGNAFKDWQEGGKGLKGLYRAGKGAIQRSTATAAPESSAGSAAAPPEEPKSTGGAEPKAEDEAPDNSPQELDADPNQENLLSKADQAKADFNSAKNTAETDTSGESSLGGQSSDATARLGQTGSSATEPASVAEKPALDTIGEEPEGDFGKGAEGETGVGEGTDGSARVGTNASETTNLENAPRPDTSGFTPTEDGQGMTNNFKSAGDDAVDEIGSKAAAAVSDAGKTESTLAKVTAVSSEDDWNPIGLVITAGLAIGTLFAGIFGHHRDGLPKHPPNAPPVMNASTQFGVAQ